MFAAILRGAAAGAAGTTALNAASYLDMAIRARPASETPQRAIDKIASDSGHPVPGQGQERQNRLQGLGPLAGIVTGVGIGAVAGLMRPVLTKLPSWFGVTVLGAAAMAAADVPLTQLGVTDPRKWSSTEWVSDAVPHLCYGMATYATLSSLHPARKLVDSAKSDD